MRKLYHRATIKTIRHHVLYLAGKLIHTARWVFLVISAIAINQCGSSLSNAWLHFNLCGSYPWIQVILITLWCVKRAYGKTDADLILEFYQFKQLMGAVTQGFP